MATRTVWNRKKDQHSTFLFSLIQDLRASLVAQLVKNLPVMWETWVQSLGWEDPLEKGMTIQSSILAWRIPLNGGDWQA